MEQWLNPAALAVIGSFISAVVASVVAILNHLKSTPIDRKAAEMATTTAITVASKSTVETALSLNKDLKEENERIRNERDVAHHRISLWEIWYRVLTNDWDTFRTKDDVPEPPIMDEEQK